MTSVQIGSSFDFVIRPCHRNCLSTWRAYYPGIDSPYPVDITLTYTDQVVWLVWAIYLSATRSTSHIVLISSAPGLRHT